MSQRSHANPEAGGTLTRAVDQVGARLGALRERGAETRLGRYLGPRRPPRPRRPRGWWRVGTPLVVLVAGSLFVISADNSQGTDLRPGRYTDLASLVSTESDRYDALQARVSALDAEVNDLSDALGGPGASRYRRQIEKLEDPAGLVAHTGPGVSVTLADSPDEVADEYAAPQGSLNPNVFVVHQQDIQAVVNALWRGGASAVTVAGQRVVSTTGIKCEGNAVTLQGKPYPQPYVIEAVGDPDELAGALEADPDVETYREQSQRPDIAIGWDFATEDEVVAPAYDGLLDLSYATVLR